MKPWSMTETPNDVITELIAAIVAARADGDGVLTIAAVRARLAAAELHVIRWQGSDPAQSIEDRVRKLPKKHQNHSG